MSSTTHSSKVHASGNFAHLIKAVSFDIVEMFRCYPLRCRGRLLRLLRCSTMRTIKLSTFERSVMVLPEITKLPNREESLKKYIKGGNHSEVPWSLPQWKSAARSTVHKYSSYLVIWIFCLRPIPFKNRCLTDRWLERWKTLSRWAISTSIASSL